jgi:NAD-dependent protein deacetylase/lipoamidase
MPEFERIVILTGAGISAESGVPTFRDKGGIWAKYDYREVATPEGFEKNPQLVHEFYNMRRRSHQSVTPNAAHFALAHLERAFPGTVTLVTQNVDQLHEQAGSKNVIHMHGEALKAWCLGCGSRMPWTEDMFLETACPKCGETGTLRPDIVWFGEEPYHMADILKELAETHLFISIGTSGNVYPAAGFVEIAADYGAHTVELNLEPSEGCTQFAEAIHGPATEIVPEYVRKLLDG